MTAQRLPIPGQDDGTWGDILNGFLEVSHAADGTLNASTVGTTQLQDNAVTNAKLDAPTQAAIAQAGSSGTYSKPSSGIPSSDLTSAVQTSLGKADTSLQATNNLSDLTTPATARTNLGLGSAATQASSAFDAAGAATTAQTNAIAASLQKASNLSDLTTPATARTNLGLGSAATQASSAFDAAGAATTAQTNAIASSLQKSSNLSDVASASTSLTNLGGLSTTTAASTYVQPAGKTTSGSAAPLPSLNVKDYGATGDGSTDDTTAIQAAITAAALSPGTVFFPAGNYVVTGLTVPPGVRLQGVGGQQFGPTFLIPNTSTVSRLVLKTASTSPIIAPYDGGAHQSTSVQINDLMLDCNGVAQPAINLPDSGSFFTRWWQINRTYVTGMSGSSGYAIYIGQNNGGVHMRDLTAFNGQSGSPAGPNAIGWYGQDGVMDTCAVGWWGQSGVTALAGASDQNLRIMNSDIFTNGAAGLVIGGGGVRVSHTSIDRNQLDGVYVGNSPVSFDHCTFHSNSQVGNGSNSNIKLGANNLVVQINECSAWIDGGITNKPIYMIDCASYSGIVLLESGNTVEGGIAANFTTSWSNYAGPQVTNYLASSTATDGNLASVTLAAGTWRIMARVSLFASGTNQQPTVWLSPNSNSKTGQYDNQALKMGTVAGNVTNGQIILSTVQTFTASTTVYLSATLASANALAVNSGTDGHSTGIEAIPVGAPRYY